MVRAVASNVTRALPFVLASFAGIAVMHDPTPASAFVTMRPPSGLVGRPVDGEGEVPTDVVLFYDALRARIDNLC